MDHDEQDEAERQRARRERERGKPGAEGGEDSESKDAFSGRPAEDDAPVGDTDQVSDAKHA